jgi:hypothetical protein
MRSPIAEWRAWWRTLNVGEKGVVWWILVLVFVVFVLLIITPATPAPIASAPAPEGGDVLWYAAIIAVSSTASPLLLAYFTNRNKRKERAEDFARQDAVAKQAAEAARLLAERQDAMASKAAEAARLLVINTAQVAERAKVTIQKLDVIHTLVNSNMTAALQSELDAVTREMAMMVEVGELKQAAGQPPSEEASGAIKATRAKITELTAALADRLKQQEIIDHQIKVDR